MKHLPGTGKEKEDSKEEVKREAAARGTLKKSKNVSVIEVIKVKGDDPFEYFFFTSD